MKQLLILVFVSAAFFLAGCGGGQVEEWGGGLVTRVTGGGPASLDAHIAVTDSGELEGQILYAGERRLNLHVEGGSVHCVHEYVYLRTTDAGAGDSYETVIYRDPATEAGLVFHFGASGLQAQVPGSLNLAPACSRSV